MLSQHRDASFRRPPAARQLAVGLLLTLVPWLTAAPTFAVIEGDPQEVPPTPTECRGQGVVRTLVNETGIEVNGLHFVFYGPENLLEVDLGQGNPFGAPSFAGLDPEGAYHVRFDGAQVPPGESVRIAFCFDGTGLASVPLGNEGAQYWLVDDEAVLEAPALPAIGVEVVPTHNGDGSFDLQVALNLAEQREVTIDAAEYALAPASMLADLDKQGLQWQPLQLDTTTLTPPTEELLVSTASAPLGVNAFHDDDIALYVRTTISAAAYEPRGDEPDSEPPPSEERVSATDIVQVHLGNLLHPLFLDLRAVEAAGELQEPTIAHRAQLSLPLTGLQAWVFKLVDDTGEVTEVALDDQGGTVDAEQMIAAEEAFAAADPRTKLEPSLLQTLQEEPNTPLEVAFWIALPDDSGDPNAPQRPDVEQELSADEVDQLFAQVDAYQSQRAATVTGEFAARLQAYGSGGDPGIEIGDPQPLVYATLLPSEIEQIASWPEVDRVYKTEVYETDLEAAAGTVRLQHVHSTGTNGNGERLAVVEVAGGRVNTSNPFLPITVDFANSCTSGHGAAVAGIVGSTHGTRTGMAPGAQLRIGGSCGGWSSQLQSATSRAISWGARAVNLSWGNASGTAPGALDRTYDAFVINHWRTIVKSAGNEAGSCRSRTGKISMPGRGYNVLTVGNFDDRNSTGWGDDRMNSCSSFVDPTSWRGDREKPEVSAPGTNINSTTNSWPWTGAVGSGTSYAAPVVTGGAGLLFDRHGSLRWWPEAVKAIFMATATNNIEGASRLSDRDGAGGVVLDQAADVARDAGSQQWGGRGYSCSSPTNLDVQTMTLSAGRRTRVAMVWNQPTNYSQYAWRPSADLDLRVIAPNGSTVAWSLSWDNTYEIAEFTPTMTGTYTIRVRKYRCSQSPMYLAWAWWQSPVVHIGGVSNNAQGAGMDITDLDGNGRPDMVLMAYHAPWGGNSFRYRIGWDLDSQGETNLWTGYNSVGGVGWEGQGAGVEVGDLNGNGRPDMVLMAYDNPWGGNTFRYRIGWDMVNGIASWWTGTTIVGGVGWEGQGAGVELVDIDGNGTDEMVFVAYDNPWGGNNFRYRIGWNVNAFGVATWGGTYYIGGLGWEGQGAGVTLGDVDNNGTLDMVLMAYDNPAGANTFRYRIGWNVNTGGSATWNNSTLVSGVGWEADGADPELFDIDGDGDLELFLMAYDDPFWVPNTFRYRVLTP